MKIEIFTRSMNYRLYDAAMYPLHELPYKQNRLQATTADGYLRALLKSDADWAINIDEDAFVTDLSALKELLEHCIENSIANCGMPDGGIVPVRFHNPLVTNPFFNIIDLNRLRSCYSREQEEHYAIHRSEYEQKAPTEMLKEAYQYDSFEPYYNFFIWTSQKFKTLYLNGTTHPDGTSTILMNHQGKPFLVHTWLSRWYGIDKQQTARINSIIDQYSRRTPKCQIRHLSDCFYNKIVHAFVKKFSR